MKIRINEHAVLIYITIVIITLSESVFFNNRGLNNTLEYLGYFLLLSSILLSFIKESNNLNKKRDACSFLLVLILSGIGLWFQNVSITRFFVLQFTIFAIAIISVLSSNYMSSLRIIRGSAYALLVGIALAILLGLVSGDGIWDQINTGAGIFGIPLGFNGGMVFKNYFSADILIIYICLSIYERCEEYKSVDKVVQFFCAFFCVLSNSRGGLVLLAIYCIALNYSIVFRIKKKYIKIFILCVMIIGFALFVKFYNNILDSFGTYAYRFRGLINYLNYYEGDGFHMFFGNAESFYDKDVSYVMAVRSTTGFDGSLEMSWLNILIKSGLLGIAAYVIIFFRLFKIAVRATNQKISTCMIALTLTCLVSSLVEAYIQSIHCVFGVMCYLIINGLYGYDRKRGDNND